MAVEQLPGERMGLMALCLLVMEGERWTGGGHQARMAPLLALFPMPLLLLPLAALMPTPTLGRQQQWQRQQQQVVLGKTPRKRCIP